METLGCACTWLSPPRQRFPTIDGRKCVLVECIAVDRFGEGSVCITFNRIAGLTTRTMETVHRTARISHLASHLCLCNRRGAHRSVRFINRSALTYIFFSIPCTCTNHVRTPINNIAALLQALRNVCRRISHRRRERIALN